MQKDPEPKDSPYKDSLLRNANNYYQLFEIEEAKSQKILWLRKISLILITGLTTFTVLIFLALQIFDFLKEFIGGISSSVSVYTAALFTALIIEGISTIASFLNKKSGFEITDLREKEKTLYAEINEDINYLLEKAN